MLERFGSTLWEVIFKPKQFFTTNSTRLLSSGNVSSALAFAVIIQWIAAFFNFLWRSAVGTTIETRLFDLLKIANDVMNVNVHMQMHTSENLDMLRSQAMEYLFGAGSVILTPFFILLKLFVMALFIHAAVHFFMKEQMYRPHRYSTTLKILAYCSAPRILCIVPGVGLILAWILSFFAAVIGLREVYHTTNGRAMVAVLFPELLLLGFVLSFLFLFIFFAFNVVHWLF